MCVQGPFFDALRRWRFVRVINHPPKEKGVAETGGEGVENPFGLQTS